MPQENKNLEGAGAEANADANNTPTNPDVAGSSGDGSAANTDDTTPPTDDEEIKIKKSELKKKEEQIENLTKAIKERDRKQGKDTTDTSIQQTPVISDESKPVLKGDIYKSNEKAAIESVTTITDSDKPDVVAMKKDIDENWDEVKKYYTPRSGKATVKDIENDIYDAYAVYRRRNPVTTNVKNDRRVRADIAIDRGSGGKAPGNSSGRNTNRLLPTNTSPKEWYTKKS